MATLSSCANCLKDILTEEDRVTRISYLNANKSEQGKGQQGQGQGEEVDVEEPQPSGVDPTHEHENVGGDQHETLELSVVTLSQSGELFQVDVEEAQQLIDSGVLRIESMVDNSSSEPQEHLIEISETIEEPPHPKEEEENGCGGGVAGVDGDVPVVEALSVIFGIPLDPAVGAETSSLEFAWKKEDNCALCHKCGEVVRILYSAFQQFNCLSVEESYVSKGIKQFLNKINSLNRLSLEGQLQERKVPETIQGQAMQTPVPTKAKRYTKKSTKNQKETPLTKRKTTTIPLEIIQDGKSRKRAKIAEHSEYEMICADRISDVSSDSNSLSDFEKEVAADKDETVRMTRTSTRRRVAKKQLSDYEELESSEEEVPPETFEDDEDDDPNFDAEEEIQDIKVSQEDVQLRRVSDICVQVLEYKEEDLQVDSDGKFICPECKKTYIGLKTLNKHVLIHKLKKAPNCPKCNIKFESLDLLHRHMTSTHGSSSKARRLPGRPPLRKNITSTKVGRMKSTGKFPKYKCSTCGEEFANQSSLTEHEIEHGPVSCPTCHKQFASPNLLMRHGKDVHDKKEIDYFCPECGEIFNDLTPLSTHFSENHNENLNFCSECGKSFIKSRYLFQHLKETHQTPEENIKVAQLSDNDDADGHDQEEHVEEKHDPLREPGERIKKSDPTPFKCPHCDKEYRRKKQLDTHLLFHNGTEPKHECDFCAKMFFELKNLQRHIQAFHSEKKGSALGRQKTSKKGSSSKDVLEHACNDCDKTFTRKEYLRLHQRIHTGERPFMCSDCGKTFRDPRNLAQHLVTHKTDRPFCCSICGLTFKRAHHLNDHEGTHREDVVRPFICSLPNCGKAFKLKKHLISHELVHSGTKDHQCDQCGKAFNRKDNLRQHVNKVHGKESNFSDLIRVPTASENENEVHVVQVQTETPTATLVPVSAITDNSNNITTIQILPTAHFTYTHL